MQEEYAVGKENFAVFLWWIFVHSNETFAFMQGGYTKSGTQKRSGFLVKRS